MYSPDVPSEVSEAAGTHSVLAVFYRTGKDEYLPVYSVQVNVSLSPVHPFKLFATVAIKGWLETWAISRHLLLHFF